MKTCRKCGKTKPLTEFHKKSSAKDGHANHCKSCVKKYQQENKEAINERYKQYYQKNKEAIAERKRHHREENREAFLERERRYKQENREAINERQRRYVEKRKTNQPGCVYQIVNSVNGRVYVGQTTRGELRWVQHRSSLRGNRHDSPHLQADFNEFGEDAFEWRIIQELPKDKEILEREEKNTIQRLLVEGKELYNVKKD